MILSSGYLFIERRTSLLSSWTILSPPMTSEASISLLEAKFAPFDELWIPPLATTEPCAGLVFLLVVDLISVDYPSAF